MNVLFELFEELSESFSSSESKESKEKGPGLAIQKMIDTIFRVRTKENKNGKLIQSGSIVVPIEGGSSHGGYTNSYDLSIKNNPDNGIESIFRISNEGHNDRFILDVEYIKRSDGSFSVSISSEDKYNLGAYCSFFVDFDRNGVPQTYEGGDVYYYSDGVITDGLVPLSSANDGKPGIKYSGKAAITYILRMFERQIDTRVENKN